MNSVIKSIIESHLNCVQLIQRDTLLLDKIQSAIDLITKTYESKHKVIFCGNGGSAADAEHLAAELSGKLNIDRPPLNADALHVNAAAFTAVSNDYSFEMSYARLLESKALEHDLLFALSTSGKSTNIIEAIKKANALNLQVIGITGQMENSFSDLCTLHIEIPSAETARIQEAYMLIGHIICQQVEHKLFG